MRVLIIDDEPVAQRILQSYLERIPSLSLAGVCKNAIEAFTVLNTGNVDLMLLDINMPEISGLDFVKALKAPPMIIFTTAYSEYAVESYNLNAIDYLLKPIPFERFLKAMDKARSSVCLASTTVDGDREPQERMMFVKSEGKLVRIDLKKLWLLESLKDYVRLHTEGEKLMVLYTMQLIEEQLSQHTEFIRISRSCIVNINYVREIDGNTIRMKNTSVTIGTTYRPEIYKMIEKLKLH